MRGLLTRRFAFFGARQVGLVVVFGRFWKVAGFISSLWLGSWGTGLVLARVFDIRVEVPINCERRIKYGFLTSLALLSCDFVEPINILAHEAEKIYPPCYPPCMVASEVEIRFIKGTAVPQIALTLRAYFRKPSSC